MGDSHMGPEGATHVAGMRKLTATSSVPNTIRFYQQIRMKIGVMFGNLKPPPAQCLKF